MPKLRSVRANCVRGGNEAPTKSRDRKSVEEKIGESIVVDPATHCWDFKPDNVKIRGTVQVDGKRVFVYRWIYEMFNGPIPDGHHAHHVCFNPKCVNPAHIEVMAPGEHHRLHAEIKKAG